MEQNEINTKINIEPAKNVKTKKAYKLFKDILLIAAGLSIVVSSYEPIIKSLIQHFTK